MIAIQRRHCVPDEADVLVTDTSTGSVIFNEGQARDFISLKKFSVRALGGHLGETGSGRMTITIVGIA